MHIALYEVYLKNSLVLLKSFSNFCENNFPEVILSFSPQYSNINPVLQYAQSKNIKVLFMESGTNLSDRLSTLRVWDWRIHKLVNPGLKYWKYEDRYQVTKESVKGIVNHYKELLKGNHFSVFSSTNRKYFDVKKEWNISLEKKVLVMTLSSYDEAFAALMIGAFPYQKVFSDVFKTQIEWIEETIKWVENRKDLFLIIRVHPRDFPNKRDSKRSEQSYLLEKTLKRVPKNVKVNWPTENVSLYQILESADVLLTGWSVTALEALILGIPVVAYDSKLPSYPKDIYYSGRSIDKYFQNIKTAIKDGWDYKNVKNGFRWLSFNFNHCTIKVSKDFGSFERKNLTLIEKLFLRIKNKFIFIRHFIDLKKWKYALKDSKIISRMISEDLDSIPIARNQVRYKEDKLSEDDIIIIGLRELYKAIYDNKSLHRNSKIGLSANILSKINEELK